MSSTMHECWTEKDFKEGKADTWEPDHSIGEFTQAYHEEGEVNSKTAKGE